LPPILLQELKQDYGYSYTAGNCSLTQTIECDDQQGRLSAFFEKSLKDYSKKANIPGFRKGMVPAGLIKKMYGNSLFVDEVLKTVDKEVVQYLESEKLDIFAQPLPVDMNLSQLDASQPNNYTFTFEVGMKPEFQLPDLSREPVKRYQVVINDDMVNEEVERLRTRYGNMTEPETVSSEEQVLNVRFTETDASGADLEGGISKDNSLLVKYFKESSAPPSWAKRRMIPFSFPFPMPLKARNPSGCSATLASTALPTGISG
jgi:trigger factor